MARYLEACPAAGERLSGFWLRRGPLGELVVR